MSTLRAPAGTRRCRWFFVVLGYAQGSGDLTFASMYAGCLAIGAGADEVSNVGKLLGTLFTRPQS